MKKTILAVLLAGYFVCPVSFAAEKQEVSNRMDKIPDKMDRIAFQMDQMTNRMDQASNRVEQLIDRMDIVNKRIESPQQGPIRRSQTYTEVIADIMDTNGARITVEVKKPLPGTPSVGDTYLVVRTTLKGTMLEYSVNERTGMLALTRTVNGFTSTEQFGVGNGRAGVRLTMMQAALNAVDKRIPWTSPKRAKFRNIKQRMVAVLKMHDIG